MSSGRPDLVGGASGEETAEDPVLPRPSQADGQTRTGTLVELVENTVRAVGRMTVARIPFLEPVLVPVWYAYVAGYVRTVTLRNRLRYEAPTDPFRLYQVDITGPLEWFELSRFPTPKYRFAGRVYDGDWDHQTESFTETLLYQGFEAHFHDGVPWEETAFFEAVVTDIEAGIPRWYCSTRAAFEDRCDRLDALYESIATHGYQTQSALRAGSTADPMEPADGTRPGPALKRFIYDEMTVVVGRDGRYLFTDGRDRLAIARLLGLEQLPVWVLFRHTEWQRLRDAVARGDVRLDQLSEERRTHPDLVSLPPSSADSAHTA